MNETVSMPLERFGPPPMEPVILPELDWEHMTLDWEQYANQWEFQEEGFYALKFVYFATRILSREHQYMNIYVPASYLNSDGSINEKGSCGGYTARTAPIVLENGCSGWKSSVPRKINHEALKAGFVYISVGARSRGLPGGVGKAPSAAVDQKAAVRLLRKFGDNIPGDKERIVSCGGSGGGQMSSILGATGNMPEYYPDLYEIGAAGIERGVDGSYTSTLRDDIFASQCYCPIADIDNADLAYAYQRFDDPNVVFEGFGVEERHTLTPFQLALQEDEAQLYGEYLKRLGLKNEAGEALLISQREDGSYDLRSGVFYQQILKNISDALNAFLKDKTAPDGTVRFEVQLSPFEKKTVAYASVEEFLQSYQETDQWLKKTEAGYEITSLSGFCQGTRLKRGKTVPGFDTFHLTAENNAFGTREEPGVHFSRRIGELMEKNYTRYQSLPGVEACDMEDFIAQTKRRDIRHQTHLMNATHILVDKAEGKNHADIAQFWRTRNGTADEHTAFSIAYNLCMAAKRAGAEVDYAMVWNAPHGDVDGDGTGSFVEWVKSICK